MIRALKVFPAGSLSPDANGADAVTLAYDDRHRRRLAMRTDGGLDFLLDLPEAAALRDGDALVLEDGRLIEVRARPEPLMEVRGRDALHLVRLAWHIGNRHLPAAIEPERILIRPDHVIAAMLAGLGATVREVEAVFNPEGGAYASGHGGHSAGTHAHPGGHAHHPHP